MAYSRAAKAVPCKLSTCSRTVKPDNPTFPYCVYHSALKNPSESSISNVARLGMTAVREALYNPGFTGVKARKVATDMICDATGLSKQDVRRMSALWAKATKSVNMFDPDKAHKVRGQLVDSFKDYLQRDYDNVQVLTCRNSSVSLPGKGGIRELKDNHLVVSFTRRDEPEDRSSTLILDPAPTAQLHGIVSGDVRTIFRGSGSTLTDGIYVSTLYEFARFSDVDYGYITNENGDTVWDNNTELGSDAPETQKWRDIINNSPRQSFPPPVFKRSPTDEDLYGDKVEEKVSRVQDHPDYDQ